MSILFNRIVYLVAVKILNRGHKTVEFLNSMVYFKSRKNNQIIISYFTIHFFNLGHHKVFNKTK